MIEKKGWHILVIPAIATGDEEYRTGARPCDIHRRQEGEVLLPDREPQSVLDELRTSLGTTNFSAQYQQDPVPPGGNVIQRSWLRYYDEEPSTFDYLLASWDPASTLGADASYSVGTLWGQVGPDCFLLEHVRRKLETPELKKLIVAWAGEFGPDLTVIEGPGFGQALAQDIRRSSDMPLTLYDPPYDKETRLLIQAARFEAGHVHLPRNAVWLVAYREELLAAPYGRYWDQVDSTTQALYVLNARASRDRPRVRRNLERRDPVRR